MLNFCWGEKAWVQKHTQAAPGLSTACIQFQNILEIFNGLWKLFLCPEDTGDGIHGGNRPLVVAQGLFVGVHGSLQVAHEFGQATYRHASVKEEGQQTANGEING